MKTKFIQTAAFLAAIALAAVPAVSQAITQPAAAPVKATYQTTLESITGMGAPWTGTLQLTINSSNIIQGYYHPSDDMIAFIPVTGGRDGDHVWLDIGRQGHLHVTGILKNDVITGTALDESTNEAYNFSARVSS